jgi:IS5 family transposase
MAKGLLLNSWHRVDATLITAPSSTKNKDRTRHRCARARRARSVTTAKKAHIGVDADSGLVHTVRGTAGNIADVAEANSLLYGR